MSARAFRLYYFFFEVYGDHPDLHVLTPAFPTRRSSDLRRLRDRMAILMPSTPFWARSGMQRSLAFSRASGSAMASCVTSLFCPGCGTCWSGRSEEHTSELQSLMRISYAVFCLQKNKINTCRLTRTASHVQRVNK